MLVFKDIVSGDEMCSDAYKMELKDGEFFYVAAELRQYKDGEIDDSLLGGNKSAEEPSEDVVDPDVKFLIDVIHDFRLVEVQFSDKKDYMKSNLKPFIASLKKHLIAKGELEDDPAKLKEWEAAFGKVVKKHILDNFNDLQFFVGESMDPSGHIVAVNYVDDKPVVVMFKSGLKEEKQ